MPDKYFLLGLAQALKHLFRLVFVRNLFLQGVLKMLRQLRFWAFLSCVAALILSGCGGGKPASASKAAIFPDSSLVVSIDMKALSDAPVMAGLNDESGGKSTLFSKLLEKYDEETATKIKESLGIDDEDLHKMTFSMKLEDLNLDAPTPEGATLVAGFDLAEEMTNEKLKNAFNVIIEKEGGSVTESGGFLVVKPPEGSEEKPMYFCAEGCTMFAGSSEALLKETLERKKAGNYTMPDAVAALEKEVEKDAHGMFLIAIPEAMQTKLKEMIGQSQGTGAGQQGQMMAMLQPFQSLKNIVGTVKAAETLQLKLVFELGSEADAKGAVTPVMQLIRMLGLFAPPLATKNITPQVKGASLSIPLEFTKDDIKQLQPSGAGMPGMGGPGAGGMQPMPRPKVGG